MVFASQLSHIALRVETIQRHSVEKNLEHSLELENARKSHDKLALDLIDICDLIELVKKDREKIAADESRVINKIERRIERVLAAMNVKKIEFADNLIRENAVKVISTEVVTGMAKGTILQTYRQGYILGERVLRPAEVAVCSNQR